MSLKERLIVNAAFHGTEQSAFWFRPKKTVRVHSSLLPLTDDLKMVLVFYSLIQVRIVLDKCYIFKTRFGILISCFNSVIIQGLKLYFRLSLLAINF